MTFITSNTYISRTEHDNEEISMAMQIISINPKSDKPKFLQIVDSISQAISNGQLNVGDGLPSVNQIIKDFKLSRDTVFKAYSELKERGIVDSVPNKGYFVSTGVKKVFLLLDTIKAYKEVLYADFKKGLPENYAHTVQFHHYDIDAFKRFVQDSIGKFSKYIIMPFDNPEVKDVLSKIPKDKLLILDWKTNNSNCKNYLYQDFGEALYNSLDSGINLIKKYDEFVFLYPEYTNHPYESVEYFKKFCKDNQIKHSVEYNSEDLNIKAGKVYISVSDRILGKSLEQIKERKLTLGKDVGFISYNETPMKQFIYNGITVVSTDFGLLGQKAAEFVRIKDEMNYCVPTKLTIRKSL
ncbi:MAG: GntR family transcriptional regulator [Bacteroidota bacterium]